jgi:hypothetical protein
MEDFRWSLDLKFDHTGLIICNCIKLLTITLYYALKQFGIQLCAGQIQLPQRFEASKQFTGHLGIVLPTGVVPLSNLPNVASAQA